jgi:hypothetical protein
MKPLMPIVALTLAWAPLLAQAASFDCVSPVFPEQSTLKQNVRRVEKQVKAWRTCYASYRVRHDSADAARLNAEVDADFEKWMAATRTHPRAAPKGDVATLPVAPADSK